MHWLANLVIYQATWFICVLGGDQLAWAPLILLGIHLFFTPCRKADLIMIVSLVMFGIVLDGTLVTLGFFTFPGATFIIPYWLIVIWMALATLPNHSLRWLKDRLALAAILGALGGPLAYWAGVRLGAATFNWPLSYSIVLLAVVWGLFFPAVMLFSTRNVPAPERPGTR
jgi:hypothetical protein